MTVGIVSTKAVAGEVPSRARPATSRPGSFYLGPVVLSVEFQVGTTVISVPPLCNQPGGDPLIFADRIL
jgi:hypothetical protein